jgi:DNA topoisomerase-1
LQGQDLAVYNLIKNRFLASLMPAAVYDKTDITVKIGELILTSSASVIKSKGYKAIYNDGDEEKVCLLSGINQGRADVSGIDIKEYQTKPPARFSESSIIKELEDKGIGRPSTYANILKTLKAREYITVNKKNKQLVPTDLGISALKYIIKDFSDLFSINYTAGMEKQLDEISAGREKYGNVVKSLYSELKEHNITFTNSFGASEKQAALAEKLAAEHNLELPKDYKTNGKACKEFIDKAIKNNPFKPSEKQIALAESISQKNNAPLPKGYSENAKVCSDFIGKYIKNSIGGNSGSKPPSEKQIAFAEKIAEKQGVELPDGYQKDWKICKEFIEANANF